MRYSLCPFCRQQIEIIKDWPAQYFIFVYHQHGEVQCAGSGDTPYHARLGASKAKTKAKKERAAGLNNMTGQTEVPNNSAFTVTSDNALHCFFADIMFYYSRSGKVIVTRKDNLPGNVAHDSVRDFLERHGLRLEAGSYWLRALYLGIGGLDDDDYSDDGTDAPVVKVGHVFCFRTLEEYAEHRALRRGAKAREAERVAQDDDDFPF